MTLACRGAKPRPGRRDRGAASLIVVMILFFVLSMVAAYTNRNLIFEQKTASNQQRSSRALEAAEAGVDWALTLLNSGRITDTCGMSATVGDTTFRERYLEIDPTTGTIAPKLRTDTSLPDRDLYPTCVYDGTAWSCSCPVDGDPTITTPVGTDVHPAFRVRFRRVCTLHTDPSTACSPAVQPHVVHIDVNGCTAPNETCLRFPAAPVAGEGRATVHVTAALKGAIPTLPSAALTARRSITMTGASPLRLFNTEITGSGITAHAGGVITSIPAAFFLQGKAGTPGQRTLFPGDLVLAAATFTDQRFFVNTFGAFPATYRDQPAAIDFDCTGGCTAAALRTKISLNPGRVFWVRGNLDFDSAGDIGSPTSPVLLNVTGNVTFSTNVTVYGLIYSQAATWTMTGTGSIVGAALAQDSVDGTATTEIVFDSSVLHRLRTTSGSFVRLPGTWRDFDS